MSQVICYARTNYFRTRNLAVLLALLKPYDVVVDEIEENGEKLISITANGDCGDFPNRLAVSEEMREFSDELAESYRFNKIRVEEMADGQLFDEIRKSCDLNGKHASDEDIETLMKLVRSDNPDDIEIDFGELVAPFIADGEVMVMNEVGMEGRQLPMYVFGHARALINTGEEVQIDLYDVEALAEFKFGIKPRRVGR